MSKEVALKPRVSEKGYALSEATNTYIFDVGRGVNKLTIANAVTDQFKVKVVKVRVAMTPPKAKRAYRGRGKFTSSQRGGARKAYVTLAEGDKLPFFASEEEAKPPKEKK